jgi:hypothetical protein
MLKNPKLNNFQVGILSFLGFYGGMVMLDTIEVWLFNTSPFSQHELRRLIFTSLLVSIITLIILIYKKRKNKQLEKALN